MREDFTEQQTESGGLIGGEQTAFPAEDQGQQPTGQYTQEGGASTPVLGEEYLSAEVEGPQPVDHEVVMDGPITGPGPLAEQSAETETSAAPQPLAEEPSAAVDTVDLGSGVPQGQTREITLPSIDAAAPEAEAAPQGQYTENENGAGSVTVSPTIGELPVDHSADERAPEEQ